MIGSFGLLNTGLVIKRVSDITGQMQASLQSDLGASFSLLSQTPEGQLVNRMAEQVADLWEFGEQVFNGNYPDTASGVALDLAMVAMNAERIPATQSVVNGVVITGTPSTTVPDTFQLSVAGNNTAVFQIAAATIIGGGGTVSASFVAVNSGPVVAPANQLTDIVVPVTGIVSATNPVGCVDQASGLGQIAETDSAFRARALPAQQKQGTGTPDGLVSAVLAVANVSSAIALYNDTDATSSNNIPPHAVEMIVAGGTDAAVAAMIWQSKAGGITTYGNTTVTVYDANGDPHQISFSRVIDVPIYVIVNSTINADPTVGPVYPPNGDALVAAAIQAYGVGFAAGQTVTDLGVIGAVATVPGMLTAAVLIGTAPSPASSIPIPIASDHIAQFLASNVVVNS